MPEVVTTAEPIAIHCFKCQTLAGYFIPLQRKLKLLSGHFVRYPFTIQCPPPCNRNIRWNLKEDEEDLTESQNRR